MKKFLILALLSLSSLLTADTAIEEGKQALKQKDYTSAFNIFLTSCKNENLQACVELGDMYAGGYGVKKSDDIAAAALYDKACNGGILSGCTKLGWLYEFGIGIPQNTHKARDLYIKTCNSGDSKACYNIAILYKNGYSETEIDHSKAFDFFTKACNLGGDGFGCLQLAYMYAKGQAVLKNQVKAKELFEKACGLGCEHGCTAAKGL